MGRHARVGHALGSMELPFPFGANRIAMFHVFSQLHVGGRGQSGRAAVGVELSSVPGHELVVESQKATGFLELGVGLRSGRLLSRVGGRRAAQPDLVGLELDLLLA